MRFLPLSLRERGPGGEGADCDWCVGCGYVYRDSGGVDRPIPPEDFAKVAAELERLDQQRLRKLGYTGKAKRPGED